MILVWILELEKIRYKKLGKPDYGFIYLYIKILYEC